MSEPSDEQAQRDHAQYIKERKGLTDAARESSRTFDQAVLAFGAAVFGASVAFIKDVATKPQPYTLKWLCISWVSFTIGLLAVILSFLFSHKTCIARIADYEKRLKNPNIEQGESTTRKDEDRWGKLTQWCNYLCVGFLFLGVLSWIVFALENLAWLGGK